MTQSTSPGKISLNEKYLRYQLRALKSLENHEHAKAQNQLESLHSIAQCSESFEILTLNNLSIVYMKQKKYNKALVLLLKALLKSKTLTSKSYQIGTLINLSSVSSILGIHSDSLKYCNEAISLLENSNDHFLLVLTYFNAGVEYFHLDRLSDAERILRKANFLKNKFKVEDSKLSSEINKLLESLINAKNKKFEVFSSFCKPKISFESTSRKRKALKKVNSIADIATIINPRLNRSKTIIKENKPVIIRISKNSSSRNIKTAGFKSEISNYSRNTSSESTKNSKKSLQKSLSSTKNMKNGLKSEINSYHSTPITNRNSLNLNFLDCENRICHIGDHLNNIEKKINDFAELCKPLKILTEDPDENLDSFRNKYNLSAIVTMQKIAKSRFLIKNQAAIKIQKAYRKYKNSKNLKNLLKFKENPLFKPNFSFPKPVANKVGILKKHSFTNIY